jgi:hypothetical protein
MQDKWSLKCVSRFFYGLKELHAPSNFFIRQYPDIRLDRIKQQRLLAAFDLSLSLTGLLPCFKCKRFRQKEDFCLKNNPSPFFYDGRDMTYCLDCLVQDGHIQLSAFSGRSTMFILDCALCGRIQHNTQTLQCLCCHQCKCGSTRRLVEFKSRADWYLLTEKLYVFCENSPSGSGSSTTNAVGVRRPTHSWQVKRVTGLGEYRDCYYYDCSMSH